MMNNKLTIPGPKGHFLSGSLPEIQRDRVKFLVDLQRDYGDVVRIKLGPFSAVVVFHPDGIQHILQDNHTNYSKETRTYASLSALVGNGLIASNGEFWLRQRRLMQPAFHRQQINALSDLMCRETQITLNRLETASHDGQSLDISREMIRLSLAIVTQALFGNRISDQDGKIAANISFLLDDPAFRFEHPFYPPLSVPTAYNRRFIAARKFMDEIIYTLIADRRKVPVPGSDLLAMLMQATVEGNESSGKNGRSMNDEQLRDEIITLFLAGHETTALALTWTLYLLSQHPDIEARVRSEIDQTLAGRIPTLADLPGLAYTRRVLDEGIRLYPPAWIFERKALADDEIGGYLIPAGTTLALTPYATHRHPQFWDNPEMFDPDRFIPERVEARPRYAYFPFGGGPRMCIGNSFALQEMQLVLPMLLQCYQFELEPGREVRTDPEVALRPKGGLWMRVKAIR
jgi:cytochrome P450